MSGRRAFVQFAATRKMSASRACGLVKVSRRRLTYVSRRNGDELVTRLKELAALHPRYGSRRLWAMLRREGRQVNLKRVRRLCRKQGLTLRSKRRRKRRGIGIGLPCKAEHPHHTWAWDFMEDRTETGRKLRILTVEDEFTRQCLAIEVEHRMNSRFVADTLMGLIAEHGAPRFIRSDNGPEFIARHLMRILAIHGAEARHIDPGSPWQNGLNERFNGTLRDECLNFETFASRDHARMICKVYGRQYNTARPHGSLGYLTPMEFAARWREEKKDGHATRLSSSKSGGGELRLSHCAPPAVEGKKNGSSAEARPDSRKAIHGGAPVARQQSRILRVDESSVAKSKRAGKVPVQAQ
ncbi:MAG: IS3 family transposase [Acidobacteriaceae bacterium]